MITLSSCSELLFSVLVVSFDGARVYLIPIPGSESAPLVSFDFSPYCRVLYFKYFCAFYIYSSCDLIQCILVITRPVEHLIFL